MARKTEKVGKFRKRRLLQANRVRGIVLICPRINIQHAARSIFIFPITKLKGTRIMWLKEQPLQA